MKAASFDYVRPVTLDAAFAALTESGVNSTPIGQSLLPMLNLRAAIVDLLVDIGRLDELKEITLTPDSLRIGALTTHAAIEDCKLPDVTNGLMQRVAAGISYRAIRHHGTIGGSLALADPAADWPACMMALGAMVQIANCSGGRTERVEEFVRGAFETSLAPGEIVLALEVPRSPEARWGFAKVTRKRGAFANSIAVAVARDQTVTVVLASAAARPLRMSKVGALAATGTEPALREAIAADLARHIPDADAYQRRLHAATILHSLRELRGQ